MDCHGITGWRLIQVVFEDVIHNQWMSEHALGSEKGTRWRNPTKDEGTQKNIETWRSCRGHPDLLCIVPIFHMSLQRGHLTLETFVTHQHTSKLHSNHGFQGECQCSLTHDHNCINLWIQKLITTTKWLSNSQSTWHPGFLWQYTYTYSWCITTYQWGKLENVWNAGGAK